MDKKRLARFVRVDTTMERLMTFWCILPSDHVVAKSSVTPIISGELEQAGIQKQLKDLDTVIHDKIDEKITEKDVIFAGISLPPIDIFEDNVDLDSTSRKS